jgi:hypothetical protein
LNSFRVPNNQFTLGLVCIRGIKAESRHKWQCGAVVEEVMREGEVTGLNPASRVAREFYAKNVTTCDFDGDPPWPVGASPIKKFFCSFFRDFFVLNFDACLIKSTRQNGLCRHFFFLPFGLCRIWLSAKHLFPVVDFHTQTIKVR